MPLPPRPPSGRVSKEEGDAALPLGLKAVGGTQAAVTHSEAEQDWHIWVSRPPKLCFTPTVQEEYKQKIKTYSTHLFSTNIVFPFWGDEYTPAVNVLTKLTGNYFGF